MSPKIDVGAEAGKVLARQAEDIDSRYHPSAAVRRQLNKVFPDRREFIHVQQNTSGDGKGVWLTRPQPRVRLHLPIVLLPIGMIRCRSS